MKTLKWLLTLVYIFNLSACGSSSILASKHNSIQSTPTPTKASLELVRQKIKHVVIIMQENRSFDSYFGTYPGADGLPMQNGKFTACVNDPQSGKCVYPFHDPADRNFGGPHGTADAEADIDG